MKKIILLFLGMLLITSAAYALTPEELKGKWVSNKVTETDPNGGGSVDVVLTFNFDGASKAGFIQSTNANIEVAQGMKLFMYNELQADCDYTVAGDSISIKINPESVKLNMTEDDIRIIGVEDATAADGMKQQMVASTQQQLPMMAEELAKEPMVMNNVMILPKKMTALIDGKMFTFKKK